MSAYGCGGHGVYSATVCNVAEHASDFCHADITRIVKNESLSNREKMLSGTKWIVAQLTADQPLTIMAKVQVPSGAIHGFHHDFKSS